MYFKRLFVTCEGRPALLWRIVGYALVFGVCLSLRGPAARAVATLLEPWDAGALQLVLTELMASSLAIAGTLTATWVFRRYVDRRPWAGIALPSPSHYSRSLALGFSLGAVMILMVFAIELATGWLGIVGWKDGFTPATIVGVLFARLVHFLATAVCEETAYRGYFLQNMAERYPLWVATLAVGAVFGVSHFPATGLAWGFLIAAIVLSFFLTQARLITGALWFGIAWHWAWDWFQDGLGFGPGYSPLETIHPGPHLWTGGRTLEDGVLANLVLAGGLAGLVGWSHFAGRPVDWHARLDAEGTPRSDSDESVAPSIT